jgi:1-deoxy-D-xylulose-5-phosphate reductoisomerase
MNSETPIKRIAIFGSTGSIGTQALNVIEANPDRFSAEVLTRTITMNCSSSRPLNSNPILLSSAMKKNIPK